MIGEMISAFEYTVGFMRDSIGGLSDEQMVAQPPGLPNHALWTLGHVAHSCQGIATEIGVASWLPGDWESRFGYGSSPSPDSARYPRKEEMLAIVADAARRLREALRAADASLLAKSLPDETMPTMGHVLMQVVVAHTAYHAGQLAAWRRAVGGPTGAVYI